MVECDICGEDFARKDILSRHKKRKYPCDGSKLRLKGSGLSAACAYSGTKSKSDESLLGHEIDQEENSKMVRPIIPVPDFHDDEADSDESNCMDESNDSCDDDDVEDIKKYTAYANKYMHYHPGRFQSINNERRLLKKMLTLHNKVRVAREKERRLNSSQSSHYSRIFEPITNSLKQ